MEKFELEIKLTEFKKMMLNTYNNMGDKKNHFKHFVVIAENICLKKSTDDMKNLLYRGLLFDGGSYLYYSEEAYNLTQKQFNQIVWSNIAQWLSGCYFRNTNFNFGTYVLSTVFFGFVDAQPYFSRKNRAQLVEKYYYNVDFDFFYPDAGITEFFLTQLIKNKIEFPKDIPVMCEVLQDERYFETSLGIVVTFKCFETTFTKSYGFLHHDYYINRIYAKNEDGSLKKVNKNSKKAKKILELKNIYDKLVQY